MKRTVLGLVALLLLRLPAPAVAAPDDRAWVELTGRGAELRLATHASACPEAQLDGRATPMAVRARPSPGFPLLLCQLGAPEGVHRASVGDWTAPLPSRHIRRVLIFGDTGCRLKGAAVQACNDPTKWPFPLVVKMAARHRPDLVIHVGDYYYRETACPAGVAGCAGSPYGDNWTAWDADFFAAAEPLLAEAPWIFVRGNHESCSRGGEGWFRLLDAAAEPASCPAESAAFSVRIGDLALDVVDGADADDTLARHDGVERFSAQLDSFGPSLARGHNWILTHRPIWGQVAVGRLGPLGPIEVPLNATEQEAVRGRDLSGVQMVVSGHIHHFASFTFAGDRPAQLIVGTGGDVGEAADRPQPKASRADIDGMSADAFTFAQFGYLLLERSGAGWAGDFRNFEDRPVAACQLRERRLSCRAVGDMGRRAEASGQPR